MPKEVSIQFSRKVTIVSFMLAIFVMYIHAKNLAYYNFGDAHGTIIYTLNQIMSETFGRIAVPFFFLQSGYWMFRYNVHETGYSVLKSKLKKKVETLVIPYLIWNTFGLVVFVILSHIPGMPFNVHDGQVVNITWNNIIEGVFLHEFYFPLWFMQDLIVLNIISPIIVKILRNKYLTYITVLVLFVLALLGMNMPFLQTNSLLLFTMGGALSVYHKDYWENQGYSPLKIAGYIVLFLIFAALKWFGVPFINTVYVVFTPIIFWKCCDIMGNLHIFNHEPSWFFKQSFFIYCSHIFIVEGLSSIFSKINQSMAWASFTYMITPIVALILIYIIGKFMAVRIPTLYGVLCGNRT